MIFITKIIIKDIPDKEVSAIKDDFIGFKGVLKSIDKSLSEIKDTLVNQAQRELAYQTQAKYTAKEIIKLTITDEVNSPVNKSTGRFTVPMNRVLFILHEIADDEEISLNVNEVPSEDNRIPMRKGDSIWFDEFPIQEIYAYTNSQITGELYCIGFR